MKLKSKKGLLIAYVEGTILVSLLVLGAYLKQLNFYLGDLLWVLFYPIIWITVDAIFKSRHPVSVSFAATSMGVWVIYLVYLNFKTSGWWPSLLIGSLFFIIIWFLLDKINKAFFPFKK